MRIPTIRGIIDRRILVNFRTEAEVMQRVLPAPFRPKLVHGVAMGGICLIRLKQIRPAMLPLPVGISSENAAHRIAVEWDTDQGVAEGVYIPRRDTSSRLNARAGGSLFPGIHHHASFLVEETGDRYSVILQGGDGRTRVAVSGTVCDQLPSTSVFESTREASDFFEAGSLGYSDTSTPGQFDGLELSCRNWHVEPLAVEEVKSSYFDDESQFPAGSVEFDCALLMRNIDHQWHAREDICCTPARQA